MQEFYEGLISGVAMLGGLCAFIYWVFTLLEKRIEMRIDVLESKFTHFEQRFTQMDEKFIHVEKKIDALTSRLDDVILEQADQRKRTDQLYQVLINLVSDSKLPRTNP